MFLFVIFFTSTLFIKLILAYFLPLLPDEAYYWMWSHHLQLGYFDHPGMIAWLFRLGHFLEPFGHAVRWPAICINHLNYIFWFYIFKELKISPTHFYSWFLLTFISPILGFGSILLTPDLPIMLFWSSSLYFFIRILKSKDLINYCFLGMSLGLGFLSKYHIVLFLIIGFFYLSVEKKWRFISSKGTILTVIFGFIFSFPTIYWNYQNDFQSFAFQINHGLQASSWKWQWPIEFLTGHSILLFPVFVFYFFKSQLSEQQRILKYFSAGVLMFFFFTSFRSSVEMNWTILAFPAFYSVVLLSDISFLYLRRIKLFFVFFNLILLALMFNGVYPHGKIFEPFFFSSQKNVHSEFSPLYGINYQTSASLWYFSKIKTLKVPRASRYDFFDTFPIDFKNFPSVFYVFKEITNEYPDWLLEMKPTITVAKKLERNYVIEKVVIK